MKTAAINKMKVRCSSMGMPQAEPILKEYFMDKHVCGWLFKVSTYYFGQNS
jgi:hypothetical protein